jgi:four helix bundle protein
VTSDEQKARGYRDLLVWQKRIALVKEIYRITATFPADERFGLVNQMRRAGVSIPSNIAEGQARRTTREFIQFVAHAEGSLAELDTQMVIATELGYCGLQEVQCTRDLILELRKMLNALRRRLAEK